MALGVDVREFPWIPRGRINKNELIKKKKKSKIKEWGRSRKEEGKKKINERNPARSFLRLKSDIKNCIDFSHKGACTHCFI